MNNLTMALLYLNNTIWTCRIATIAEIVNDEGPGSRNRPQNFARQLEYEMWRAHADGRVRPSFGTGMGNRVSYSNRHQRFAGSALANDDCRSRGLQMLGNTRDGQGLSRKRLPQERLKSWRQRIVWPLQRRIHLDDTCPKLLRESSQIFVIGIHGGTPEDGSEHAKRPGSPTVSKGRSGIVRGCCVVIRAGWQPLRVAAHC